MRQLAYVGEDGQVHLADLDLGTSRLIASEGDGKGRAGYEVVHNWPTWSPDGRRLAFFRFEVEEGSVRGGGVQAVAADGSDRRDLYRGGPDGSPIYMCWSPDGRRVAILVQEANQLHLRVADFDAPGSAPSVASGAPLYFVWRPDSRGLVIRVGPERAAGPSRILWVDLDRGGVIEAHLLRMPSPGHRAPAWSLPLGSALFAVGGDGSAVDIVAQSSPESTPRTIARAGIAPAFVPSPTGAVLAYSARVAADSPLYQGVWLHDVGHESGRQISEEPLLAFFWCPDGVRLVYVTGDLGNRTVGLRLLDAATGARTEIGWLRPTRDMWLMFGHFDQYAQSASLFSPSGGEIVLASSEAQERHNGSVPTVRRVRARALADPSQEVAAGPGRLGFWRPAPSA